MKTAVIAILLVFAATLTFCAARPRGQENEQQKEVLKYAIEEDGNLLTGHYYLRDLRLGLRFRMTRDSMALETWDHTPLISFGDKMRDNTARLVEYAGKQFLQLRQESNSRFFAIHQGNRKMVSSDLKLAMPIYRTMGEKNTKNVFESASKEFLAMPETQLIVELAKALGHEDVTGRTAPASLNFYGLAMRINKFLTPIRRQQRSELQQAGEVSTNSDHWMNKRAECEKEPIGELCVGRCGSGCTCWWWVCGDCCYHQGCYEHDLCCQEYMSAACLLVWGFSCDSYEC